MKKMIFGIVFVLLLFFVCCSQQELQQAGEVLTGTGALLSDVNVPATTDPNALPDALINVGGALAGAGVKVGGIILIIGAILRALLGLKKKKQ